eukprot:3382930-Amphidinium_carterae.1
MMTAAAVHNHQLPCLSLIPASECTSNDCWSCVQSSGASGSARAALATDQDPCLQIFTNCAKRCSLLQSISPESGFMLTCMLQRRCHVFRSTQARVAKQARHSTCIVARTQGHVAGHVTRWVIAHLSVCLVHLQLYVARRPNWNSQACSWCGWSLHLPHESK